MRTVIAVLLALLAGTVIGFAGSPSSAAQHAAGRETVCGPPLHANGRISIASAGAHAKPRLSTAAMVGWLFECNHDKATFRAMKYLDAADLHKPMPKGMWYWPIEGGGGIP